MIISASRRTDIPAFYGKNFIEMLKKKYKPEDVDCIVFWTKDPYNFMQYLNELDDMGYKNKYYFQFTITGYNDKITPKLEPNVGNTSDLINIFCNLACGLGKERVIWRYDPILFADGITADYHKMQFIELADRLHNYTEKVVISFVNVYGKLINRFKDLGITSEDKHLSHNEIAEQLYKIANMFDLKMETCAENINVPGITKGKCIDPVLIERITGKKVNNNKDTQQRSLCRCCPSLDVGYYNTCKHGCVYCYANGGK